MRVVRREPARRTDFVDALYSAAEEHDEGPYEDDEGDPDAHGDVEDGGDFEDGADGEPEELGEVEPEDGEQAQCAEDERSAVEKGADALDAQEKVWPDFLKTYLHPKSVAELPGAWAGVTAFDGYGDSCRFARGEWLDTLIADRVRHFVEDCDTLQGFHVLAEDTGGFGALTEAALTELRDEYTGAPALVFSTRPPLSARPKEGRRALLLSDAVALAQCAPLAGTYVPLGPGDMRRTPLPHVSLDPTRHYHTAGLLSAAVDTVTMPWRTPGESAAGMAGPEGLRGVTGLLSGERAAPVAALELAMPVPELPTAHDAQQAADARMASQGGKAWALRKASAVLTPELKADAFWEDRPLSELAVLRGGRRGSAVVAADEARDTLGRSLWSAAPCRRHCCALESPMPVPLTFPRLFAPTVLRHGDVVSTQVPGAPPPQLATAPPVDVPVSARLAACPAMGAYLRGRAGALNKHRRTAEGAALLAGWELGAAELDEASETLLCAAQEFDEESDPDDFVDVDDVYGLPANPT